MNSLPLRSVAIEAIMSHRYLVFCVSSDYHLELSIYRLFHINLVSKKTEKPASARGENVKNNLYQKEKMTPQDSTL